MRARNWFLLLLLIPFVALLYPAFYSKVEPKLLGFPFFLWYQFLWAVLSAALTLFVYWVQTSFDARSTRRARARR